MRTSLRVEANSFSSVFGRVNGRLSVGMTCAGGETGAVDIDGDGRADIELDAPSASVAQFREGRVVRIETDRRVRGQVQDRMLELEPYNPKGTGESVSLRRWPRRSRGEG